MENNRSPIELEQPAVGVAATVSTDFQRRVYCLLGLPLDAVTLTEATDHIRQSAVQHKRCFLSTPNLNFLMGCLQDADFRNSVLRSDLSVADGMPLVWLSRLMGLPIRERVAGSSIFERLGAESLDPIPVYFFGGPDGVAKTAAEALQGATHGLSSAGYYSPGFGSLEEMSAPPVISAINRSGAGLLVVALGAKRGQLWIEKNLSSLTVPVVAGLGAVVNFAAGSIARAPLWLQKCGLEWVWRIKEEPALWRRYLKDGVTLLGLLFNNILPLIMSAKSKPVSVGAGAPQWSSRSSPDGVTIKLSGVWCDDNLQPMRGGFEALAQHGNAQDIVIDCEELHSLDNAAIALLMLLYGHQSKIGKGFKLQNVSRRINTLLRRHCAIFLLGR